MIAKRVSRDIRTATRATTFLPFAMHDDQILDGSDGTTGDSTQTQRRTALKDTMKAALLLFDGLDRSSINDLAKDEE